MNEEYRLRTKRFAIAVIRFVEDLPKTTAGFVLGKQLLRSATSVAANYRAMCLARSVKEQFAKLCIVVEEADETLFWLELFAESNAAPLPSIQPLQQEAHELARIFTAYRSKLRQAPHES